jgi:hypothetical protein
MEAEHSLLFRYGCRLVKYFALFTLGVSGTCLLASILGQVGFAITLLNAIWLLWLRIALSCCLILGFAVIFESLR